MHCEEMKVSNHNLLIDKSVKVNAIYCFRSCGKTLSICSTLTACVAILVNDGEEEEIVIPEGWEKIQAFEYHSLA